MCSTAEIISLLSESGNDTAKKLVDRALDNGGGDNVTCIVIEVRE